MSENKKPFNNPFAALEARRAELPSRVTPSDVPTSANDKAVRVDDAKDRVPAPFDATREARAPGPARAVVRLEKKGRRGKEVTVVEHLALGAKDLEVWLKALKAGLGCGGAVEGDALALQGDQRTRIEPLLVARGVRKITIA